MTFLFCNTAVKWAVEFWEAELSLWFVSSKMSEDAIWLAKSWPYLSFLVPDSPVKVFALHAQEVVSDVKDAAFSGDGTRCVDVISRNHSYCDSRPLTLPDSFWNLIGQLETGLVVNHPIRMKLATFKLGILSRMSQVAFPEQSLTKTHLWPNRILDSHHSNADEVVDDLGLVVPFRRRIVRNVTIRYTDGTEAVTRHRLNHLFHHFITISRSEWTDRTALGQNGRTSTQKERERDSPDSITSESNQG